MLMHMHYVWHINPHINMTVGFQFVVRRFQAIIILCIDLLTGLCCMHIEYVCIGMIISNHIII
jgi:hypothetical protein